MGKWRAWLGIALILLSAAGLLFWETTGRETVLTEPVLVAAAEIPEGMVVTRGAFSVARVPKENLTEGVLAPGQAGSLYGRRSGQTIPANQQIVADYFKQETFLPQGDQSVFVLPEEWIAMRSSSLRKGDWITLYGSESLVDLGTYSAAFVKDQAEQEVTGVEGFDGSPEGRTHSTAQIALVEIAATLEQYQMIRAAALTDGGLLLVQETAENKAAREQRETAGNQAAQEQQEGVGKQKIGIENPMPVRSGKLRSRAVSLQSAGSRGGEGR